MTLYAAAENEYAIVLAQLFVTILPAIYMAAFELLLAPLYTENKAGNFRKELTEVIDEKWEELLCQKK